MKYLLCALLAALCAFTVEPHFAKEQTVLKETARRRGEALLLPKQEVIRGLSVGYARALAHMLWFDTISYFGREYRGEKNYQWLKARCSLVTELNPKLDYVYEFCSQMLAWEAKDIPGARNILTAAIETFPDSWLFYYLRGFLAAFFEKNTSAAKDDFVASASRPGATPVVISLASKKLQELDTPQAALQFLQQSLAHAHDEITRTVIIARMKEAATEIELQALNEAYLLFVARTSKKPQDVKELAPFVPEMIVKRGFRDLYGGLYSIDENNHTIVASQRSKQIRWKHYE